MMNKVSTYTPYAIEKKLVSLRTQRRRKERKDLCEPLRFLRAPLRYKKISIAENAEKRQSYAEIEAKNPSAPLPRSRDRFCENLCGPLRYKKVSIAIPFSTLREASCATLHETTKMYSSM